MLNQLDALGTFYRGIYNTGIALLALSKSAPFKTSAPLPTPLPSANKTALLADMSVLGKYFDGDMWAWLHERKYDFDLILEPKTLEFELFNSSQNPKQLLSILPQNASGFKLEGITSPITFRAKEERIITFTAEPVGDLKIITTYSFIFEDQIIIIAFIGRRLTFFNLTDVVLKTTPAFDYAEGEYLETDIFTAQDGNERRVQLIERAKRYVEYSVQPKTNEEVVELEEVITRAMKTFCYQPLWFSATKVSADSDQPIISCDTTERDFNVGDAVMIRTDTFMYIFAEITEMDDNSLTLERIVSVRSGWLVVPLIKVTPENGNSYSFTNKRLSKWTLTLRELI